MGFFDIFKKKKSPFSEEQLKIYSKSTRRPYITCKSELELYNKQKNYLCSVKEELKLNYKQIKEQNKHFVSRDYTELTFYEISLYICNNDLHLIANEGVYYLMIFISLGSLSMDFNENIDFIKMEINYILEKNLLENLKERINKESYIEMQHDLNNIKQHFGIC